MVLDGDRVALPRGAPPGAQPRGPPRRGAVAAAARELGEELREEAEEALVQPLAQHERQPQPAILSFAMSVSRFHRDRMRTFSRGKGG